MTADEEVVKLRAAIQTHCSQKADDRCWMDDQQLYAAAGLVGDNTISDPAAMLENCKRFIACRMAGGDWPTYQQIEAENINLRAQIAGHCERIAALMRRRNPVARKSDEVEALAKVLWDAKRKWQRKNFAGSFEPWSSQGPLSKEQTRAMARAAIAHLSKTKRGAKRGK